MGFLDERAALAGKVAVVAGGGGGLGGAIAVDLARAGVRLALWDRDEAALDGTRRTVEDLGAAPVVAAIDVRDVDAVSAAWEAALDRHGHVDILVNVVAGTFRAEFLDTNARGWDAVMRTTFSWLLHTTHLAASQMRDQGTGGSIINLTSIEAHRAAPSYAVYSAMKAAVTQLTRTLAVELAPLGIRVNNIAPDQVPTPGVPLDRPSPDPLSGVAYDPAGPEVAQAVRSGIPMGRRGTFEDIGSAALFLASDLSSYITGTTLHPDGGAYASAGWWNWPGAGWVNMPPAATFDAG